MEFFRVMHLRCPRLSIYPFVKGLCDLHGVPFKSGLTRQFTTSFDLYVEIRSRVHQMVQTALGREHPRYRLSNACPACQYRLEGEPVGAVYFGVYACTERRYVIFFFVCVCVCVLVLIGSRCERQSVARTRRRCELQGTARDLYDVRW